MGMYDVISVPCPNCGKPYEAQSKSGPCFLGYYTLEEAPANVLEDVNRHSPFQCECGCMFEVDFKIETKILERKVIKLE